MTFLVPPEFTEMKHTLVHMPVSADTQKFFAESLINTNPIFSFLFKDKNGKKGYKSTLSKSLSNEV